MQTVSFSKQKFVKFCSTPDLKLVRVVAISISATLTASG
jgi:hypothetical protein